MITIHQRYTRQANRQTDRRTDGRTDIILWQYPHMQQHGAGKNCTNIVDGSNTNFRYRGFRDGQQLEALEFYTLERTRILRQDAHSAALAP